MGAVIVFFLIAVVVSVIVLAVVAGPHLRSSRERAVTHRHTSRTRRADS